MKQDERNEKYIQELNQVKADEKLKKRILSNAENERRKRGIVPIFSSVLLVAVSIILVVFVIGNGETNTGTPTDSIDVAISEKQPETTCIEIMTSEGNTGENNTSEGNTGEGKEYGSEWWCGVTYINTGEDVTEHSTGEDVTEYSAGEDMTEFDTGNDAIVYSTGEDVTEFRGIGENNTGEDIPDNIFFNVIISGTYGQDDFKILFVYRNERQYNMMTGRDFWIEVEDADGNYSVYKEKDLVTEDDLWVILPGQTRTEKMTNYFTTAYPKLTKEIANGKKVRICDELIYYEPVTESVTVKSIPKTGN